MLAQLVLATQPRELAETRIRWKSHTAFLGKLCRDHQYEIEKYAHFSLLEMQRIILYTVFFLIIIIIIIILK
jgi:hypothetical protein